MNKLLTDFTGGFPFLLNDLRFMDDAIRLAIKDIVTSVCGDGPVILTGCQVTQQQTYVSVSEGAIFYQGEIWHVYPHNFAAPNPLIDMPVWAFITANGPEGSRTFENAESHQVHQIRKAVGSYLPIEGAVNNLFWDEVPRFSDVNNSTYNLTLVASADLPGRSSPSRSIRSGRIVSIDAGLSFPVLGSTFYHAATIQSQEHYPGEIIEGITPATDNVDPMNPSVIVHYKIDTDGKIYVRRLAHTASPTAASLRLNVQYLK
jgi:hypothetical protein